MDVDASTPPSENALEAQMKEIEHQITHLIRSNAEIKEILETEGEDKELRAAIVRGTCPPTCPRCAQRDFSPTSHLPARGGRVRISLPSLDAGPSSRICNAAYHSPPRLHQRQRLASAYDGWELIG